MADSDSNVLHLLLCLKKNLKVSIVLSCCLILLKIQVADVLLSLSVYLH